MLPDGADPCVDRHRDLRKKIDAGAEHRTEQALKRAASAWAESTSTSSSSWTMFTSAGRPARSAAARTNRIAAHLIGSAPAPCTG